MSNIPEISYGNYDPITIIAAILERVENNLGRTLYPADPLKLFVLGLAAESIELRNYLDNAGSQTLLSYAEGANLDALGDLVGCIRLQSVGAKCTLRFTASVPATSPITIPAGTRATPDGLLYFATDYDAIIPQGWQTITAPATCVEAGSVGNGFLPGEINKMVDVIGGVPNVINTDTSSGGADIETDDAYRERIRLAPAAFSAAGPVDTYIYHAKSVSSLITDVYVTSPQPGYVDVYLLLIGGQLPSQQIIDDVQTALSADTIRPLTDYVTVKAPTPYSYNLSMVYYIDQRNEARQAEIIAAVNSAIAGWIEWQRSAIGRDINPSELTRRVLEAGARRVVITSPSYQPIQTGAIAVIGTQSVVYGGLEYD